jgi:hypothetical protein
VFTILQFIFYVGLYKVTTMLYNPYDAAGANFDLHEYLFVWMSVFPVCDVCWESSAIWFYGG